MSVLVKSKAAGGFNFKMKSRIGLAVLVGVLWVMLFTYMGSLLKTVKSAAPHETPTIKVATQSASPLWVAQSENPPDEDSGTVNPDEVG